MPVLVQARTDDEIADVIEKIRAAKDPEVGVVLPRGNRALQIPLNARLLSQFSKAHGRRTAIVSDEPRVQELARANGLTVLLIAHDINPLLPIVDRVLYVAHGGVAIGKPAEVITTEQLSRLYDAPIEVLHDSHGHMFVVGLEAESGHHDA